MKIVIALLALALTAAADGTCTGCTDYGPVPGGPAEFPTMSYGKRMVYTVDGLDADTYQLTLTFQDPISAGPGVRLITATVNDQPFLLGFDVYATAGHGIAQRSMVVPVTDGKVVIVLTANTGHSAILSGITLARANP